MNARSVAWERALAGAAVGGLVTYLYLTDDGRKVREQAEAWLDDFLDAMTRMQSAVTKAHRAIEEGRSSWDAVIQLARPTSSRSLDAGPS